VRPSATELQVILGPIADQVAGDMRASMRAGEPATSAPAMAEPAMSPQALVQALGGPANIREVTTAATRLCFTLGDAAAVDQRALDALPVRAIARLSPTRIHAIIGPDAGRALEALTPLLAR
jgi:PTS system N-acetylglucosamine-specific IIC component